MSNGVKEITVLAVSISHWCLWIFPPTSESYCSFFVIPKNQRFALSLQHTQPELWELVKKGKQNSGMNLAMSPRN